MISVIIFVSRTQLRFIMIEVLCQHDPYRYVKMPDLLENGQPDYRIQKWNNHNGYKDMYLCDNFMQFKTAINDFEYTKWLDPDDISCYKKEHSEETLGNL